MRGADAVDRPGQLVTTPQSTVHASAADGDITLSSNATVRPPSQSGYEVTRLSITQTSPPLRPWTSLVHLVVTSLFCPRHCRPIMTLVAVLLCLLR